MLPRWEPSDRAIEAPWRRARVRAATLSPWVTTRSTPSLSGVGRNGTYHVIPARVGIPFEPESLDPDLRRADGRVVAPGQRL